MPRRTATTTRLSERTGGQLNTADTLSKLGSGPAVRRSASQRFSTNVESGRLGRVVYELDCQCRVRTSLLLVHARQAPYQCQCTAFPQQGAQELGFQQCTHRRLCVSQFSNNIWDGLQYRYIVECTLHNMLRCHRRGFALLEPIRRFAFDMVLGETGSRGLADAMSLLAIWRPHKSDSL